MSPSPQQFDALVLGAGAAGLFCAGRLSEAGLAVAVVDQARKPAEKVRISGGGRCNFTNRHSSRANFLSSNPKFCISALKRFGPQDFLTLVEAAGIAYHEKSPAFATKDARALGQLFCDSSSQNIISMLLAPLHQNPTALVALSSPVDSLEAKPSGGYRLTTPTAILEAPLAVVATGGKSIPKMGASGIGYRIAEQFGHALIETRAGLVPFTLQGALLEDCKALAGVATKVIGKVGKARFEEGMLFTHRGLSGPAMLQLSSYWREGESLALNFLPDAPPLFEMLREAKQQQPRKTPAELLAAQVPRALAVWLCGPEAASQRLADLPDRVLRQIEERAQRFHLVPSGTEGYRTAEVTLGGVDTRQLSSQTMESLQQPGLYFIGEVVDVTGHLGGHNFQWAWASAAAAADAIMQSGAPRP